MGPALAEGRAVSVGIDRARPAARRVRNDHPHTVRRPGHDRVHGDLLLRGLDDPDLRQPVLESRRRPEPRAVEPCSSTGSPSGPRSLNFLILVWLLKRFLYKPILDAMDAREARIAAELADLDASQAEARQEREEFRSRNEAFDRERAGLLSRAAEEAQGRAHPSSGRGGQGGCGPGRAATRRACG